MKIKVFTLKFSEKEGGFNDQPMQDFIADKEVIEFSNHFFIHDKSPYLLILISYRDISPDERRRVIPNQDPRKELDNKEKEAYDALKTWRMARAKQEGIPPYLIANNKQLAKMVTLKAKFKADLAKIPGFGEAKIIKYSNDILKLLAEYFKPSPVNQLIDKKDPQK